MNVGVQDSSDLRKYRTEIPNVVLEMGLSPYALSLYVHLKRTAGQEGECYKSTRRLAKETSISVGKISAARAELEERELISIVRPKDRSKTVRVTITDIWLANFKHFSECSPHEQSVHHMNAECSPHEPRNKPNRKEHNKEEDISGESTLSPKAKKKKVKKLSPEEAEERWDTLLSNDSHGPSLHKLSELLAERNKSGEVAFSRCWRELGERYVRERNKAELSDVAWEYGFQQALAHYAANIGYVIECARGYRAEARPLRVAESHSPSLDCAINALETYNRDGITDLQDFAPLARKWDFTLAEKPPWEIFRELGGNDEERWRNLKRIQSVSSRAVRSVG